MSGRGDSAFAVARRRIVLHGASLAPRATETGMVAYEIKDAAGRVLADVILDQEERAGLIGASEVAGDEADRLHHLALASRRRFV